MFKNPYLISLALIEQGGNRLMPLGGKSLVEQIKDNSDPGEIGQKLANDVLIRVFQKSQEGSLKRAADDLSLLLIQIPMDVMQEELPAIKSNWIKFGDTNRFLGELHQICFNIWSLKYTRDLGTHFIKVNPPNK